MLKIINIFVLCIVIIIALLIILPTPVHANPPKSGKKKLVPERDESPMELVQYKKLRSDEFGQDDTPEKQTMLSNPFPYLTTSYDRTRYDDINGEIDSLIENFDFLSTSFQTFQDKKSKKIQEEFMKQFAMKINVEIESSKGSVKNTLCYFQESANYNDFQEFRDSMIQSVNYIRSNMKDQAFVICTMLNRILRSLKIYGAINLMDEDASSSWANEESRPIPLCKTKETDIDLDIDIDVDEWESEGIGKGIGKGKGKGKGKSTSKTSKSIGETTGECNTMNKTESKDESEITGITKGKTRSNDKDKDEGEPIEVIETIETIDTDDDSSIEDMDDDGQEEEEEEEINVVDLDCDETLPVSESGGKEFSTIEQDEHKTSTGTSRSRSTSKSTSTRTESRSRSTVKKPKPVRGTSMIDLWKENEHLLQGPPKIPPIFQLPKMPELIYVPQQPQSNIVNRLQKEPIMPREQILPKEPMMPILPKEPLMPQPSQVPQMPDYYQNPNIPRMLREVPDPRLHQGFHFERQRPEISQIPFPSVEQGKAFFGQTFTNKHILSVQKFYYGRDSYGNYLRSKDMKSFRTHVKEEFMPRFGTFRSQLAQAMTAAFIIMQENGVIDRLLRESNVHHVRSRFLADTLFEEDFLKEPYVKDNKVVDYLMNNQLYSCGIFDEQMVLSRQNQVTWDDELRMAAMRMAVNTFPKLDFDIKSLVDPRLVKNVGWQGLNDLEDVLLRRKIVVLINPKGYDSGFDMNKAKTKEFFHAIMLIAVEILTRHYFPHMKETIGIVYKEVEEPLKELEMRKGHMTGLYFMIEDTYPSASIFGTKFETMGVPVLSHSTHVVIHKTFGVTNLQAWHRYINKPPQGIKLIVTNFANLSIFIEAKDFKVIRTILTDDFESAVSVMVKHTATAGVFWGISTSKFRNSEYDVLDFPYCAIQGAYFGGYSLDERPPNYPGISGISGITGSSGNLGKKEKTEKTGQKEKTEKTKPGPSKGSGGPGPSDDVTRWRFKMTYSRSKESEVTVSRLMGE